MAELALLATVASGVGTAVQAVGAIAQGRAGRQQADFQAQVIEQQAGRDEQIASLEARNIRRGASAVSARQRALLAASGVAAAGTPLLVLSNTAAEGEFEALLAEAGGETAALRKRQQAGLTRVKGRALQRASFFRAGSSLLSGGAGTFELGRELEVF